MPCRRARLAGLGEAALAALLEARLGAGHGARAEVEGLGQGGLRGEAEQGAAAEAEIAAELVVDGVGGNRVGVEEVDDTVAVAGQAEPRAERESFVGLEAKSGGQRGGLREGLAVFHKTYYIASYWACQVPRSAGRELLTSGAQGSYEARKHFATSVDVTKSEAFPPGDLSKRQGPELLGARKAADTSVAAVASDDPGECSPRKKAHELGEERLATIHLSRLQEPTADPAATRSI